MALPHNLALSLLTLCISQHLYAQTDGAENSNSPNNSSVPNNSSIANASEKDMPTHTLDMITVVGKAKTGTALAQKISEMPAVTQVIREEDIQGQITGNRTVGDILAQLIPSLGTSSGSTSNYGTTMRGRPVQYLLNGVPLSGSRSLSRELNSIDPAQLERVEVLSGATSIYGAGAAGGLINLVTKSTSGYGFTGQSRVGINSSREFESDSLGYHVGQSLGYGGEQVYGRLDIDYESKGGKFDSHGDRISPDVYQTDQQDTDSLSVNVNVGMDLSVTQNVNLAATYYNDEQDTDYGFDYGEGLAVLLKGEAPSLKAVKGVQIEDQPKTQKTSVNLNYNNSDFMGSNLSITGYYRDEEGRFYPSGKSAAAIAYPELIGLGIPADNAAQLAGYATAVTQSDANIEVSGLRAALQTDTSIGGKDTLFSYGIDFEREKDEQTLYGQNLNTFIASNGLIAEPNGVTYNSGPKTTIDKLGAFINVDADLTDKWQTSAGVRYQKIEAETDDFIPVYEQLLEEYFANPAVAKYTGGHVYQAGKVKAGNTDHDKTLFNLGTSYQLTPNHLVFANFSQGFTTADIQRALRDVRKGFVVNSKNVQPIAVDNYELGWQGKFGTNDQTHAKLTGFYNESDKTVRFTKDYMVEVVDTDERVYGAEAALRHNINDNWQVGGTVAYTRGQYEVNDDWVELDAVRLTPLKGTAFIQYNFDEGSNLRLQALAVDGTDKAHKEQTAIDPKANAQPVTGYATLDLLGQVKLPKGRIDYGIYNLLNKDYKSVYHQTTYDAGNRIPAVGTNYGISYTIDY